MKKVMTLERIHELVVSFLSQLQTQENIKPKRGRPVKYQDDIIIALFLYQILFKLSFRETLEHAKQQL